ncbi:MAG: magnesium/cobalt transporter CorA [Planctomycetota bacterium]
MDEIRPKPPRRRRTKRRSPPGTSPGTLIADPAAPKPVLTLIAYGPEGVREEAAGDLGEQRRTLAGYSVLWLDVGGLGDAGTIQRIGEAFGLHRLALEDVINVHQRPKVEVYGEHRFIVARAIDAPGTTDTEQLTVFLGPGFVVTFQEQPGGCFDFVRERIRSGKGVIRSSGPDYLVYSLLDAAIDTFFPALESLGERLETLEDEIVTAPRADSLSHVHAIKRDLLSLRRAVWPQREALSFLLREDEGVISRSTRVYLNDCYDHTVQLMDLVETYREIASGLTEIYLSSMSHRLNEVMKVLTMIATIFIPLTFIVGVYGMNFDTSWPWNMPELRWKYGYPACLAAMALIGVGLYLWFRRRGWVGHPRVSRKTP